VVFFDRPMLLEAHLELQPPSAAAYRSGSPRTFDEPVERVRSGCALAAGGRLARPRPDIGTFPALFARLRGFGLVAIGLHPLDSAIAFRDACTTTSPAFEPGGRADQEGAVDTDSNASRAGKSKRKCGPATIFCCPASFENVAASLNGQSAAVSTRGSGGSGAVVLLLALEQTGAACRGARPVPGDREPSFYGYSCPFGPQCSAAVFRYFRAYIHRHREGYGWGALFAADNSPSFRFWGSVTSGRLAG